MIERFIFYKTFLTLDISVEIVIKGLFGKYVLFGRAMLKMCALMRFLCESTLFTEKNIFC